jgi:hypothetical protein
MLINFRELGWSKDGFLTLFFLKNIPTLRKVYQKGGLRVFDVKNDRSRMLRWLRRKEGLPFPEYHNIRATLSNDLSKLSKLADDIAALKAHLSNKLKVTIDNKIILLQAFENAVVGRSVQPMNLNLHNQGLSFIRLKVTEHVIRGWPTIPQAQVKMIVEETLKNEVLSLCAIELGLEKFAKLIPKVFSKTTLST